MPLICSQSVNYNAFVKILIELYNTEQIFTDRTPFRPNISSKSLCPLTLRLEYNLSKAFIILEISKQIPAHNSRVLRCFLEFTYIKVDLFLVAIK